MAARPRTISEAVRDILTSSATYNGRCVTITDRVDEALWQELKRVLKLLKARYLPNTSTFQFAPNEIAETIVLRAVTKGHIWRDSAATGYVPTPPQLAEDLIEGHGTLPLISGRPLRILECSAGTGVLVAIATERYGPHRIHITAIEPDARRASKIPVGDHITVRVTTFEEYLEQARAAGTRFDLILMNPPFSRRGRQALWVDHLFAAWELLAPGGRIMPITTDAVLDETYTGKAHRAYDLVHRYGSGKQLDSDAFHESGIKVRTAAVWLDRLPTDVPSLRIPSQAHPSFLPVYSGAEPPVPVTRPFPFRAAAETMPVQLCPPEACSQTPRVLRYCGECVLCRIPTWAYDNGDLCPLSFACYLLRPTDYGYSDGRPVSLCFNCNNGSNRLQGLERAHHLWSRPTTNAELGQLALHL